MVINKVKTKNILLFLVLFIGYVPHLFYSNDEQYLFSLFSDITGAKYEILIYYIEAFDFIILAWCIFDNKGIDKRLSLCLLVMVLVDFVHLSFVAKQGLEYIKIPLSFLITYILVKLKIVRT